MDNSDVPSPIDLRTPEAAREWEANAQSRPGRDLIFESFALEIEKLNLQRPNILELGSGPGFLAAYLLKMLPDISLYLLDFSSSMHDLARFRLSEHSCAVRYIQRDFKHPEWTKDIGLFDAVITNQAVHELRHKRHATGLHAQVKSILRTNGIYLVSDHFYGKGGLENDQLYMTAQEQAAALSKAGFHNVCKINKAGSLVLHCAA